MRESIMKFIRDEEGATVIEYALIASLIAVALIASMTGLRDGIAGVFTKIVSSFT